VNQVPLRKAMADLLVGEPAAPVSPERALVAGRAARRSRWAKIGASGAVLVVALVVAFPATRSFLAGDRAQPGPAKPLEQRTAPYVGYPDSIAVIGIATANGYHTDPAHPGATIPENSWATGTNPRVNSLYQRILAHNNRIKGHRTTLVDPEVVAGEVSQFGSPTTQIQALTPDERAATGQAFADFSCVIVDPSGQPIPRNLNNFEFAIHGYEAAIKEACDRFPMCGYDEGAFGRTVEAPGDIGPDLSHLSVQGQAKAAAVAWKALQDLGFLPRD
jgi:hypothetical protein